MEVIQFNDYLKQPLQLAEQPIQYLSHEKFELRSQMPVRQVKHFLNCAYQKSLAVIIQVNPQDKYNKYIELTGYIQLSGSNKKINIVSENYRLNYLLHPKYIRHIRRLNIENDC